MPYKLNLPRGKQAYYFFLFLIVLAFSQCANDKPHQSKPALQYTNTDIIHEYHKLYANLESGDIYIAPVISSRFLLTVNVAIQECCNAASAKYDYVPDNEFTFQNKYETVDSIFLADLLNETLSTHLKTIFKNRVIHSEKIVDKTYEKIKQSIQNRDNHNADKSTKDLSRSISEVIIKELMPCEYAIKPDLTYRDSIKVRLNNGTYPFEITWVENMKHYNSFLPKLKLKEFNSAKCTEIKPPDKSEIVKEAVEIYTLSKPLTQEAKWIAEFWSDDLPGVTFSPVTRWFNILNQIIEIEKPDFQQVKNMYFLLSLAMHESIVTCWDFKYSFYVARPSHIIQYYIDPTWKPFHDNPSFPAYPSGHSTFGSSAAYVLEYFFGPYYIFTDNSHKGNKAFLSDPRTFSSFKEMAEENAKSRMYLGVHFRNDCEDGLSLGNQVATYVIDLLSSENVN